MPSGLVPKTKAFWLSLKVSSTITTESVSLSEASRRACETMICEGSLSKQMNADVDVRLAEQQPHLGPLGRRLALRGSCCVNEL